MSTLFYNRQKYIKTVKFAIKIMCLLILKTQYLDWFNWLEIK